VLHRVLGSIGPSVVMMDAIQGLYGLFSMILSLLFSFLFLCSFSSIVCIIPSRRYFHRPVSNFWSSFCACDIKKYTQLTHWNLPLLLVILLPCISDIFSYLISVSQSINFCKYWITTYLHRFCSSPHIWFDSREKN